MILFLDGWDKTTGNIECDTEFKRRRDASQVKTERKKTGRDSGIGTEAGSKGDPQIIYVTQNYSLKC